MPELLKKLSVIINVSLWSIGSCAGIIELPAEWLDDSTPGVGIITEATLFKTNSGHLIVVNRPIEINGNSDASLTLDASGIIKLRENIVVKGAAQKVLNLITGKLWDLEDDDSYSVIGSDTSGIDFDERIADNEFTIELSTSDTAIGNGKYGLFMLNGCIKEALVTLIVHPSTILAIDAAEYEQFFDGRIVLNGGRLVTVPGMMAFKQLALLAKSELHFDVEGSKDDNRYKNDRVVLFEDFDEASLAGDLIVKKWEGNYDGDGRDRLIFNRLTENQLNHILFYFNKNTVPTNPDCCSFGARQLESGEVVPVRGPSKTVRFGGSGDVPYLVEYRLNIDGTWRIQTTYPDGHVGVLEDSPIMPINIAAQPQADQELAMRRMREYLNSIH